MLDMMMSLATKHFEGLSCLNKYSMDKIVSWTTSRAHIIVRKWTYLGNTYLEKLLSNQDIINLHIP